MHTWTDIETEELLRAAVFDEDCWGYCRLCGMEISPTEPDANQAWCESCGQVVPIESLRSLGLL